MSLAMANALFFSSPFFMSILAKLFLKEKIGIRRWSAIFVGFIGVYIVLNPNFSDFNYFDLAPVACALCYASSMTITKITSEKDNVFSQMLHLYVGASIISIFIFFFTGNGQFNNYSDPTMQFILRELFTNPSYAYPYIVVMGIVAAVSFYCVFSAYSVASPSVVSLFEYSLILWSMIAGYLLFQNIPTTRTFFGVALIIGAGDYFSMRETLENLCEYAGTGSKVFSLPMRPVELGMNIFSKLGLIPLAPYHSLMYGRSLYFSIDKAKKDLNFEPKVSTNKMFQEAL